MSSLSFSFRFYCIIQFSRYNLRLSAAFCLKPLSACMAYVVLVNLKLFQQAHSLFGGLKWTRTTDLTLIRRAL